MRTDQVKVSGRRTALVTLIAIAFATSVVRGAPTIAPHETIARPTFSFDVNYLAVRSDFDGDRRLDEAELHIAGTHHCIRVRLATRETHLDFGTRPHSSGVLMVRDANRDNRPDLIWVYRSHDQSAVIWLNDGAGHFAESRDGSSHALTDSVFGDTDYAETRSVGNQETYLAPSRPSSDFTRGISFDLECLAAVMNPSPDFRRDLSRYLSQLRERGPPQPV